MDATAVTLAPNTPKATPDLFVDSTDLLEDPVALRARAVADGYLFFRKLLPAAAVLEVRKDLLGVVEKHGWRVPGQNALGGEIDAGALNQIPDAQMRDDIGVSRSAYDDVQKLESVHRLPHHENLIGIYRVLFGEDVLVHARHIVRMISPHRVMTPTPPHQDFPLIQGTNNTWTCWFPLGDCARSMGGLTVLRGSHRLGYLPIERTRGAGNIAAQLCPAEVDWVEGDFEIGDVLTFPSYTVHKALRTQHPNQIRLSMDVRYQPMSEITESASFRPHCDLKWAEIYADWSREDLQYYWERLPLKYSPFDESLLQAGARRIC